ncbi:hypothetical protein AYI69_g7969 [Smittium culicis]|uniref:Uncharacterized protein n=1 Tax=Smittium culicis TaxID=133412 RepID=A0A1R1XN89_9FUNG|nr:hypothetical protein AYI69_g7969 [Smittium culicis]
MSHDGTNMQDATTAPEWAMELIRRISQLEAQRNPVSDHTEADIDVDSDNYIVEKSPQGIYSFAPETVKWSLTPLHLTKWSMTPLHLTKWSMTPLHLTKWSMTPPSLNEMGLSSELKKEDSKIHDIQYRISGLTRPIDYLVHNLLQDPNSLNTANAIYFSGLMRTLLSDLASQVTQLRMDEAYKASKIPGKTPQIIPSSSKPLFDQKEFDEHIGASQALEKAVSSTKPHNKKGFSSRRWNKPAFSHQNQHGSTQDSQPVQHKPEAQSNNSGYSGNSRSRSFVQRGRGKKSEPFLSNFYDTQEIRRVKASSKSEAVKQIPTPNTLQNGKFKYSLQNGKEKGLDDKHRFIRFFSPCSNRKILQKTPELHLGLTKLSIPSAAVRTIPESTGVHESTSPCSEMGKTERNTHKCIFIRSNHLSTFQGRIGNKDEIGYEEAREFIWG